ncbi:hypothetical protein [Streptomyces incanus]|uniref:Uncharacterized protein n=1 Tax=Streptomyces incanus TaxID=887453 RepID=A0ABW0XNT5_9ACTN
MCSGVQTITGEGFSPVRFQCGMRSSVHTSASGRLPASSSTRAAGLKVISCCAIAAFSAARSVEWTR